MGSKSIKFKTETDKRENRKKEEKGQVHAEKTA